MARLALFTCALLAFAGAGLGKYLPALTPGEFDASLDPSKASILVEFYAPWCGHCKALAPEFAKLGARFATSSDIVIAQVDADKYPALGQKFDVSGFPTMKWIPRGKTFAEAEDVNERTADGLIKFVEERAPRGPSPVVELTDANFDEVVGDASASVLVGFFASWCGHCKALKPTWEKLASAFAGVQSVVIASVDGDKHKSLATKYDVSGYPTLKLFPAGSEEPSTVEIARDLETLLAYVNDHAGTDIASDGGVTAAGGIVPEIAESIRQLLSAESADERASIAEACAATVQGLDEAAQEKFRYYERVFRKIDKHGAGYVAKEHGRLTGMLEGEGNLQVESKRMFQRRINVLKQFDEL